jgi:hypothetical protein
LSIALYFILSSEHTTTYRFRHFGSKDIFTISINQDIMSRISSGAFTFRNVRNARIHARSSSGRKGFVINGVQFNRRGFKSSVWEPVYGKNAIVVGTTIKSVEYDYDDKQGKISYKAYQNPEREDAENSDRTWYSWYLSLAEDDLILDKVYIEEEGTLL